MDTEPTPTNPQAFIAKCLCDLKDRHPGLSDGQIADKIGVSRPTFNRTKNEQKIPRLDNLVKILMGLGSHENISRALETCDDELRTKILSVLSISLKEEDKIMGDKELEEVLNDRDAFIAYLLADLPSGTNEVQLVEVLGNAGLLAIKKLKEKNIVIKKNGRYELSLKGTLIRSFESAKHHLSTYSRFYRVEHQGKNYLHSLYEGLNEKGVEKIRMAHKEFHETLRKIYRDKNNQGNVPSFSVAFCDTLAPSSTEEVMQ